MTFPEFIARFESLIYDHMQVELLENHYMPYMFGSGIAAYRIKGKNVKLVFDRRDSSVDILISLKHIKYPDGEMTSIYYGTVENFFTTDFDKIIAEIKSPDKKSTNEDANAKTQVQEKNKPWWKF